MSEYRKFALEKLKDAGFKITKPRSILIELLEKYKKVLTPYEMRDLLKSVDINADIVTIYRILDAFEKLGLVHKVLALNGYVACDTDDLSSKRSDLECHHSIVCKVCHRVEEVHGDDLSNLRKKITQKYGFLIEAHTLEFIGICKKCASKSSKK